MEELKLDHDLTQKIERKIFIIEMQMNKNAYQYE